MKFIHAADIHLDSPLIGLYRYEEAPVEEIRGATRQAFKNLIELAIAESVDFVLIAGDLYDGDWKDYRTGLFLAAQMAKLRESDIQVFIIAGNHDAESRITKYIRMPDNVKMFPAKKPDSIPISDSIVVHGQGFTSRAVYEDLSVNYPDHWPGYFNIGLLHTSADGREGHDPYAPCTLQGLLSKNYDYWALGHVHKREILHEEPLVLFPGNIQGRYIREVGNKGCTLVIEQDGKMISAEHHDLDVLRWSICRIDAARAVTGDEVLDHIESALREKLDQSEGRSLAIRIEVIGACKAHNDLSLNIDHWINNIYAIANDLSKGQIWIEKVGFKTQLSANLTEIIGRNDPLGSLIRTISNNDEKKQELVDFTHMFDDLHRKLPSELRSGDDPIDLQSPETFRSAIEDVKQLLLTRILTKGMTSENS